MYPIAPSWLLVWQASSLKVAGSAAAGQTLGTALKTKHISRSSSDAVSFEREGSPGNSVGGCRSYAHR